MCCYNQFYDYFCIITGGLFECFDDLEDPSLWQGLSEDPESQEQGRIDILQLANHIVPGHGKMFQVPETYKQHLRVVMYTEEHYEQTIGNRTTSTHQSEYVVIEETDWRMSVQLDSVSYKDGEGIQRDGLIYSQLFWASTG